MSNETITNGKQIKISSELHQRIYTIAERRRKETGRPQPAYVVVDEAVRLLEKKASK